MVAYSFKQQFVEPIRRGLEPGPLLPGMKRQTIRVDRIRHARPGEQLQLYRGMRSRACFLIGRAVCTDVLPIFIRFARFRRKVSSVRIAGRVLRLSADLEAFARRDGFPDWPALRAFWQEEHPGVTDFLGVIVLWEPGSGETAQ